MKIAGVLALIVTTALSLWLAIHKSEQLGALEATNGELESANEFLTNDRNRIDRLYLEKQKELSNVEKNLSAQLDQLEKSTNDPCAHAVVGDDRLRVLQQPVWINTPVTMPDAAGGISTGNPVP